MSSDRPLVIGAGPFGLSVSAHLHALGVDHRIVGRTLDTWRAHMPSGMMLRSEPYGSDLAAPVPGYDVGAYSRLHGLDYVDRLGPLSIERFLDYADWYVERFVPDVADVTVTGVTPVDGGFRVSFAEEADQMFGSVVVATGVLPYKVVPDQLASLPAELVSHTSDHHDLATFRGRSVAVVGGGQSALETAALLHEAGAQVHVIVRAPALNWLEPNPEHLSALGRVRRPVNKLCEGWHCAFWNSPAAFRMLPRAVRVTKARTVLGPAGAWWLRARVEGRVDVLTGHRVLRATAAGSGVHLDLGGGQRQGLDVDHVIAGTGFRIDVGRLPFLSVERLRTLNGYPVVSRAGESSLPGLYFAGAPAAVSLGPSVRFIAGTHTSARQIARSVSRRAPASPARPAAGMLSRSG
ncbi:MAG TPA: FAD-dependent oxidoreductase [Actinomycetes bacterium]|nr:FAD-dependent oxidoreductase [Actinomycetes bacterium]